MNQEPHEKTGLLLDARRSVLAEAVTARHYELKPELAERYGPEGRAKCLQDAGYHLSYLSEAVAARRRVLFADYVAWAKVLLAGYNVPEKDLIDNLIVLRETLNEHLPEDASHLACEYVDFGIKALAAAPSALSSLIDENNLLADLARQYLDLLLKGQRADASRLILAAVDSGALVKDIYLQVFQPAQHEIGRLWQTNEISVAQEHYATAATQMIMSQLYPHIFNSERNNRTLVATCVSGDLHEIGVRMVSDFFEMEGWDTFYLGANTPHQSFVQTLVERRADLAVISATMTFHVRLVRDLIDLIHASEECRRVKIMVGGYPFNVAPDLWQEVGADAYSPDALAAVEIANRLVEQGNW